MNKKDVAGYIRIALYAAFIIYALIMGNNVYLGADVCTFHRLTGFLCPSCGATRAALAIIHLDFKSAFNYNAPFTFGVFPVCFILAGEDAFTVIYRTFTKKKRISLLEGVFIK